MPLQKECCSLEPARQLKELGVEQNSLYYWVSFRNESSPKSQWSNVYNIIVGSDEIEDYEEKEYLKDLVYYSAFTSSELGEMLPEGITEKKEYFECWYQKNGEDWCSFTARHCNFRDKNLANSMAKMLIYLKQNNLI